MNLLKANVLSLYNPLINPDFILFMYIILACYSLLDEDLYFIVQIYFY